MGLNTRDNIPSAVRDYYMKLVLVTAAPLMPHARFAQKRTLLKKSGDTAVFRRWELLDTAMVPLNDGITPPGADVNTTIIKARASQYGNYIVYTDQVDLIVEDPVLNENTKILSENYAQTIDELTRDVLLSCATVLACVGGTNGNTPTEITTEDFGRTTRLMLGNNAKFITDYLRASPNIGTGPQRPAFIGMIHTDLLLDLENCDFTSAANYSGATPMEGEWGITGNIRWLYTSVGYHTAAVPAVYHTPIVGKEAYGAVKIGTEQANWEVKEKGSAGTADPLSQRGSVGWNDWYVARILNDNFMAVVQSTLGA